MPTTNPKPTAHDKPTDTSQAVDAYMARLDHPCKPDLERIRRLILSVDPAISEGIKWNAPSFRTHEYFATANLRGGAGLRIILHLGAKARELPPGGVAVDDPAGLLTWLAKDRAMIEFGPGMAVSGHEAALRSLLREWIRYV